MRRLDVTLDIRPGRYCLPVERTVDQVVLFRLRVGALASLRDRRPVNLAVVLDRCMESDDRLAAVRRACGELLRRFDPDDRATLVGGGGTPELLMQSTCLSERQAALAALDRVARTGPSPLVRAWMEGGLEVTRFWAPVALHRILVVSDGTGAQDQASRDAMLRHVAELHARGVSTSTLSIGANADDEWMASVAQAGGGNAWYAETDDRIERWMIEEAQALRAVLTERARLTLTLEGGRITESLNDFRVIGSEAIETPALRHDTQLDAVVHFSVKTPARANDYLRLRAKLDAHTPHGGEPATEVRAETVLQLTDATTASREAPDQAVEKVLARLRLARIHRQLSRRLRTDEPESLRQLLDTTIEKHDHLSRDLNDASLRSEIQRLRDIRESLGNRDAMVRWARRLTFAALLAQQGFPRDRIWPDP